MSASCAHGSTTRSPEGETMPSSSSYPSGFDAFDDPGGNLSGPPLHSDMHKHLNDAVEKMQAEMGTSPSGAAATIAARFTAISANVQAFAASGTWNKPTGAAWIFVYL